MPTMMKRWSERWSPYREGGPEGFYHYDEHEERYHLPEDVRKAAATALEMAARDLGITDPLLILWYVDAEEKNRGFSHPDELQTVWVRATKNWQDAMATVAHEVKHLAQYRAGYRGHAFMHDSNEAEAEAYAMKFMRQFWPR